MGLKKHYKKKVGKGFLASALLVSMISPSVVALADTGTPLTVSETITIDSVGTKVARDLKGFLGLSNLDNVNITYVEKDINGNNLSESMTKVEVIKESNALAFTGETAGESRIEFTVTDSTNGQVISSKLIAVEVLSSQKLVSDLLQGEEVKINGEKYILIDEKELKFVKKEGISLSTILNSGKTSSKEYIGNEVVDDVLAYLNSEFLESTGLKSDISNKYYNYDNGNGSYVSKSQVSFIDSKEFNYVKNLVSLDNILLRDIVNGKSQVVGTESSIENLTINPVIVLDKDSKVESGVVTAVNSGNTAVSLIGNDVINLNGRTDINLTEIMGNKRGDSFIYTIDIENSTSKFTEAEIEGDILTVNAFANGIDNLSVKVHDTENNLTYNLDLDLISHVSGTSVDSSYVGFGGTTPEVTYTDETKAQASIDLSSIYDIGKFKVINNSGNAVDVKGNIINVSNESSLPTSIYVELTNAANITKLLKFDIDGTVEVIPPEEEPSVEEPPVEEPPVEEPPVEEPPVEEPPVEEPPVEKPPVEVPVITGTISDKEVTVGSEIVVDLKQIHSKEISEADFAYKIVNNSETVIETKYLQGGYLVIKGIAKGEGIVKVSLENEAGSSDVIEIKTVVNYAKEEKTSLSKTYGIGSAEIEPLSNIVDSKYLNDNTTSLVLKDISKNSKSRVLIDGGNISFTGVSEGESVYNLEVIKDEKVIHTYELKVLVSASAFGLKETSRVKVELHGETSKKELNLNDYFVGTTDKTSFIVSSGVNNVVSANVVNGKLIIQGLNKGEDLVTVKAKEGNVQSKILDIDVSVKSDEITSDLKIQTADSYKAATSLFTQIPSGAKLVSLKSEATPLVTISLEDDLVKFKAVKNGKGTVKLTGTDSLGNIHTLTLNLEVDVASLNEEIKTKDLKIVNSLQTENISNIFENLPSNYKLKDITVTTNSLVKINLNGNKLEFTALKNGTDTIQVSVKDENNNNKEYKVNLKITTDVKELEVLNETIKLTNETTEQFASTIFKNVPSGVNIKTVYSVNSSLVDITFKDNKLVLKALKNGTDTVKLTATGDNNKEYIVNLKITTEVEKFKEKEKEKITFTSSTYDGTIDFAITEGTTGSKLNKELIVNFTDSKLTYEVDGVKTTVDIKMEQFKKDKVYLFMNVDGELIPLNAVAKNNGSYDVKLKYKGKIIVTNEQEGFSNIYGHYAEDYITELASKKILEENWTDGSKFEVSKKVTASEFTKVLNRSLGLTESDGDKELSKIIGNKYYNNASSYLSREDAIVALFDVIKSKDKTIREVSNSNFTDFANISSTAQTSVATLQNLGIIHGKPVGNTEKRYFDGEGTLTRAQLSKIIALSLRHLDK